MCNSWGGERVETDGVFSRLRFSDDNPTRLVVAMRHVWVCSIVWLPIVFAREGRGASGMGYGTFSVMGLAAAVIDRSSFIHVCLAWPRFSIGCDSPEVVVDSAPATGLGASTASGSSKRRLGVAVSMSNRTVS